MAEKEKQYVDILEVLDCFNPKLSKKEDLSKLTQMAMFVDNLSARIALETYVREHPNLIGKTDALGRAALHWIVGENNLIGVKTLISCSDDIDVPTVEEGYTPLMISCSKNGSAKMTKLLLHYGADHTARTKTSATAFHIAVASGNRNSMRVLILYGADPFLALQDGRSALDIAPNEDMKALVYSCLRSALLNREKKNESCVECEEKNVNLFRCGNCYAKFYCGKYCQVEHWKSEHSSNCPGSVTAVVINDSKKSKGQMKLLNAKSVDKTFVIRMHSVDGDVIVESEEKGVYAKIVDLNKKMFIKSPTATFHWARFADNSKKEVLVYFAKSLTIPSS